MNKIIGIVALVLSYGSGYAQDLYTIKGVVKDSENQMVFGNVLLLDTKDSSLVKGEVIIDGKLEISKISRTDIFLKITSIGFKDTIINPQPTAANGLLDIGTIKLRNNVKELNTVTVSASLPLFESSANGDLKVNVGNTMLASSTTVVDVLSKSPSVIVDDNGISVVGKGQAMIYLNGKRISEGQLAAIQVSQIKNIEIISSPSSKYDSNGKAVINIITFKSPSEGLVGELLQNTSYAKHPLSYTSIKLNYQKNKLALSFDYGQNLGTGFETNQMRREVYSPLGTSRSVNDFEDNSKTKYIADYLFGVAYDINPGSSITAEYMGAINMKDQHSAATTLFYDNLDHLTTIKSTTTGALKNINHAININYNKNLDTLGSTLFIGAQYYIFNADNNSLIDETIDNSTVTNRNLRMNQSTTDIAFATAQLDVEKFMKKGGKFEYGVKYTNAGNAGKVDFYSKEYGQTEYFYYPQSSNDFIYNEHIPAAYLQYLGKIKSKMNYLIGLRSEYTDARGISKSTNQTVIDKTYLDFFPCFSINYKANEKFSVYLALTSTINRPSYQAMDPFLFYVDSLTASQGNPKLKPEHAYSPELNLTYKGYSLKLGYTLSYDPARYAYITGANGPNSSLLTQFNIQQQNSYFATLNVPLQYKNFQSYNVLGCTFDQVVDNRPEFKTGGFIPRVYLYSNNSLMIKKIGRIELNCRYLGTRYDGIYYRKPAYNVSAGISRRFFKNKLKCAFIADDIFSTNIVDGYYQVAGSKVSYLRTFNTHLYKLTLSYKFGTLKQVNYKSVNVGDDSDSRIQK